MKNYTEIEILLNRYLQCETNEEEEQRLCDFFLSCNTLPEQWQPYKALFAYRQKQAATTLPNDFVAKLMSKQQTSIVRRLVWRWSSIAACIAVFVGIAYFANRNNALLHENELTLAEAHVVMFDALILVSDNLNKSKTVMNEGLCNIADELIQLAK